jgi:hypothetical protein
MFNFSLNIDAFSIQQKYLNEYHNFAVRINFSKSKTFLESWGWNKKGDTSSARILKFKVLQKINIFSLNSSLV